MPFPGSPDASPQGLAARIARRLGEVPGVAAVVLGGSHAAGTATADSDVDLGIYYHPGLPLDIPALQALADALDDRGGITTTARGPEGRVTQPGEWGPWVNGGAWLRVEGQHVDWLFRDVERVSGVIADCRAGRIQADYSPGYAHAFQSYTYLAETAVAVPLFDPGNLLAALKALTLPYPPALREAVVRRYLVEARFALAHAAKPAARQDVFAAGGDLFRAAACMVQVLFALNETYLLGEKGALARVDRLARRPRSFRRVVERVLASPGRTPAALRASVDALDTLLGELEALAGPEGTR